MTSDGNGKWQLAFWLVNVVCGIWLLGLTSGVIRELGEIKGKLAK